MKRQSAATALPRTDFSRPSSAGDHLRPSRLAGQALLPALYVPDETVSKSTVHAPAVPAILNDPFPDRGAAFAAAEREAPGLAGRLPVVCDPAVTVAP
jgi:hypothetical protein